MNCQVFSVVTLVNIYRPFEGVQYLHIQGQASKIFFLDCYDLEFPLDDALHCVVCQKPLIFLITAVIISHTRYGYSQTSRPFRHQRISTLEPLKGIRQKLVRMSPINFLAQDTLDLTKKETVLPTAFIPMQLRSKTERRNVKTLLINYKYRYMMLLALVTQILQQFLFIINFLKFRRLTHFLVQDADNFQYFYIHRKKQNKKSRYLNFLSMKRYFHQRVKEVIPSRKMIVAKIINVFVMYGNFITALKKDSHFSLF